MNRILGLYKHERNADTAIRELLNSGFDKQQFGILTRNAVMQKVNHKEDVEQGTIHADSNLGTAGGAAVGGLTGLLVGAASLVIPGVGPILAAGSMASILTSIAATTGMGIAAGGLLGTLTSLGISEDDAKNIYSHGIKNDDILLVVNADQQHTSLVTNVMRRTGATEIQLGQQIPEAEG